MAREKFRLVEAAAPLSAPMQRYRDDGVKMFVNRNGTLQVCGQRPGQRLHSGILEQVNQPAQGTFVDPETGRVVEPAQTRTASSANAPLIERPRVEKRRVANGAEVIGLQRRGRSEAIGTDRNACPFEQRAIAHAAIVGEKQRKNSVGDPANEIDGSRSRYRVAREGAPPAIFGVSAILRLSKP